MKLRNHLLPICISLAAVFNCSAQDPTNQPITPLTPNAAGLGKFGDVPIGYHTGQSNISIPLHQIDYPTVSVPISLTYNYNGLKVEEYPGWVGTGWTLTGTGVINRQQRSLPDELANGYNGLTKAGEKVRDFINTGMYVHTGPNIVDTNPMGNPSFNDWLYHPNNASHFDFLTDVKNGTVDSEPDMFIFNFPGYSGKFFFDHTQCNTTEKQAIIIPHQNLEVKGYFNYTQKYPRCQATGKIEKFEITDERGNKYTFEKLEESTIEREYIDNGDPEDHGYNNSWYLSKITDPFGNTIDYSYGARTIDIPPAVREEVIMPHEQYGTAQFFSSETTEAILERITFRNGYIDFVEEASPRLDWNSTTWKPGSGANQPHALDKVELVVGGSLTKEFEFSYSYFGDNARLRLDSLHESNTPESKPPFKFYYKDWANFPRIGNEADLFSQDHWGYFTGTLNSTLLPPYQSTLSNGTPVIRPGNSRTPNHLAAAAGILTRIEYPTGGFTSFEYEPHDYAGDLSNTSTVFNICAGSFTKEKTAGVEIDRVQELTTFKEDIQTITISADVCAKAQALLGVSGCSEAIAYVQLKSVGVASQYFISARYTEEDGYIEEDGLYKTTQEFTLPAGIYELIAGVEDGSYCGGITPRKTKASLELFVVNFSQSASEAKRLAGGMRVSKVMDCATSPCSGCITRNFEYVDIADPTISSGILINGPSYIHDQLFLISDGSASFNAHGDVLSASSLVPLVSAQGSTIGYRYVTVKEELDGSKGKTIHHFTSANEYPDDGEVHYPFAPRMDNDWKRGALVFRRDYKDKEGIPEIVSSQETTNQYKETYNNQEKPIGIKVGERIRNLDYNGSSGSGIPTYIFEAYSIFSGWRRTGFQTNYSYEGPEQMQTITSYAYNNPAHMQPTMVNSFTSDGRNVTTYYKYRDDVGNVANLSQGEIDGILANPNKLAVIEQQDYRGTTNTHTKRNLYNGIRLDKVLTSNGGAQLEDQVTINAYDSYGNILSYTTRAGETRSYLYGYSNMYPIAEVINAVHTVIYTNSFETNGSYLFDVGGKNMARSGGRVLTGGSFTITGFTPSNPSVLKMSYWYWNGVKWNFSGEIPYSSNISTPGTHLDEIRVYPAGARMTTYTYQPGTGITSMTDVNNLSQFYEYDALGRLVSVRDDQGNVLKAYQYEYK